MFQSIVTNIVVILGVLILLRRAVGTYMFVYIELFLIALVCQRCPTAFNIYP
jgi:hypothetical protein